MRTARTAAAVGVAVLLALVAAPEAHAHGGAFQQPGSVGPGLPRPPGLPGLAGPSTPGGMPRGPGITRTAWRPLGWQTWWHLNLETLLPGRDALRAEGVVTPTVPVFRVGRASEGFDPPFWSPAAEEGATDLALPYLVSLLRRRNYAPYPMVAAALIAVGRIARHEPYLELIQGWAADGGAPLEVRESAVLALGLLRRTQPERQFEVEDLERIRDFLLVLFDDEKNPTRVRAFALFSLALLADQPYGSESIERDGKLITRALWLRLQKKHASSELPIALLTALGHQPPRGVPSTIRQELELVARGRNLFRRNWDRLERSHAVLALARLGGPDSTEFLLTMLRFKREHDCIHCAALLGLAHRAEHLMSEERVAIATSLRKIVQRDRHWLVRGLGHLTLGRILNADLLDRSSAVLDRTDVARYLDRESRTGSSVTRPFSAVAYGLSVHRVPRWSRPVAKYIEQVRKTSAWGLEHGRGSDEVLGAYAVAVGLSRAEEARRMLVRYLKNRNRAASLRAECALALAQVGPASPEEVDLLIRATRERISAHVHFQAVRALGMLGAKGTRKELLKQLGSKRSSRPALAAVAGALGRLQDPKSALTLLDLARDRKASSHVRVAAVMALGLTFDPEERPSRAKLTTGANFPALTPSLVQVFNIM